MRPVVGDKTLGVRGARILIHAWVNAGTIDTGFVDGALLVGLTSLRLAADKWVSFIAWRAATLSPMVLRIALSIHSAWVLKHAGIEALPLMASLVVGAFVVRIATS